ncbi:hypothetical protein CDAR_252351 [Caerostris darwini]|uniref:DUF4817 domain-containing protein n=1 Tax=Caerostris darwini TaxID=1538125 RepID=A0AAV4QD20_9ARAC|nr:hypothetical protein CDAR_252351 [Caerostris darwini]
MSTFVYHHVNSSRISMKHVNIRAPSRQLIAYFYQKHVNIRASRQLIAYFYQKHVNIRAPSRQLIVYIYQKHVNIRVPSPRVPCTVSKSSSDGIASTQMSSDSSL